MEIPQLYLCFSLFPPGLVFLTHSAEEFEPGFYFKLSAYRSINSNEDWELENQIFTEDIVQDKHNDLLKSVKEKLCNFGHLYSNILSTQLDAVLGSLSMRKIHFIRCVWGKKLQKYNYVNHILIIHTDIKLETIIFIVNFKT